MELEKRGVKREHCGLPEMEDICLDAFDTVVIQWLGAGGEITGETDKGPVEVQIVPLSA